MYKLLLAFSFVAIQLLAKSESSPLGTKEIPKSTQENVQNSLNVLKQDIQEAIRESISRMLKAQDFYKTLSEDSFKLAKSEMDAISWEISLKFDKYTEEATLAGVQIADCIGNKELEIVDKATTIQIRIKSCSLDSALDLQNTLERASKNTRRILKEVEELEKELNSCQETSCYVDVQKRVMNAGVFLRKDIGGLLHDFMVAVQVQSFKVYDYCSVEGRKAFKKTAEEIVGSVEECIKNEMQS